MDRTGTFSLLFPVGEYEYFTLSETTANDLSLDYIIENLTSMSSEQSVLQKILMKMPISKPVIQYRQAIYQDLKMFLKFAGISVRFLKKCSFILP